MTAQLAVDAGADDEGAVAAGVLHDIARVVPRRGVPHETAGAAWCEPRYGKRVAWLVGAHVAAKRYLVATDPSYRAGLSQASIRSLARQGGALTEAEAEEWAAHPWAHDAARLRRWDDGAKIVGGAELDLDAAVAILDRVALPNPPA